MIAFKSDDFSPIYKFKLFTKRQQFDLKAPTKKLMKLESLVK